MIFHRIVDGFAAVVVLGFLMLEHVLQIDTIPEVYMSIGDVLLHVVIFGTLAWHTFFELMWSK